MSLKPLEITGLSNDKKKELVGWATDKFRKSVEARSASIDGDYRRWIDNYMAKPAQAVRTTPFYKASNFVPHLIRMHTDILAARIIGLLFGTRPFWRLGTFNSNISNDLLMIGSDWMDKKCRFELDFYDPIDLAIFLTVKTGLHVVKNCWVDESHIRAGHSGERVEWRDERLVLDNVPFDDIFPYPITVPSFAHCEAIFHRIRLTKEDVQYRKAVRWWDSNNSDVLLTAQTQPTLGTQTQAQNAGINLTPDVTRPYTAIEMWGRYQLEAGKYSDIVLVFNPNNPTEKGLLKLYYNYLPPGLDPFVDFRIMPRENLVVGDCVPNMLEQTQEEQAQIHNGRRDANLIANVPGWKKKRLASIGANPSTEWYPGKVFELDDMGDLEPLTIAANYNSLIEEESALLGLAERYTGISPAQQGFGTGPVGKKGIYASQATLALLTEGNKRLDIYLSRMRRPFHKQGRLIFTSYRDLRGAEKEGKLYGKNGAELAKLFNMREPEDERAVFFGLGASDASANKEVDRQNLLLMSNTMAAYYKEIMQMAPMVATMPDGSPAKELCLQVLDGARDLANRILFVFDVWDRTKLIPDVRQLFGGGRPDDRPKPLDQAGVPEAEGAVSSSDLASLSSTLTQIAAANAGTAQQPPNGSGRPI